MPLKTHANAKQAIFNTLSVFILAQLHMLHDLKATEDFFIQTNVRFISGRAHRWAVTHHALGSALGSEVTPTTVTAAAAQFTLTRKS